MKDAATAGSRRKIVAGCALVLLAACVCAVSRSAGRAELLTAATNTPAQAVAQVPDVVFTSVDAQRIYRQLNLHAERREAAFERQVEALRRKAAHGHELHEQAVSADVAKGEKRVLALDKRKLPQVFDSQDRDVQLAAAAKHASQHEERLEARIGNYQKLEAKAHGEHEALLRANEKGSSMSEARMKTANEQQAGQSVMQPAQQMQDEKEAASYAVAREQAFEANVVKYRQAEHMQSAAHTAQLVADEKAHALETHRLVEDALEPVVAAASKTRGKKVAVQRMVEARPLGIYAAQETLHAAQKNQVVRQMDFKNKVKEESEKALESSLARKHAALNALQKMHAKVDARKAKEAASKLAWTKKREERKAVQKMLASTQNMQWPSAPAAR